jgi:hypothetical protein
MRFALVELKIALCKLMLKYEVVELPEDRNKLHIIEPSSIRFPRDGVSVTLRKRTE